MKKRFIALLLTACFILSFPLSCSALTVDGLFERDTSNLFELFVNMEEHIISVLKDYYDKSISIQEYFGIIKSLDPEQFENDSLFPSGSSSSGSANFVPSPTESLVFYSNNINTATQDDLMYIYSCILGVYACSPYFACYGDYSRLESPYQFVCLPSYSSDCKLTILYGNYLYLYGPYSGAVYRFRFSPIESGDFEIGGIHYRQKWRVERNINRTCDISSGQNVLLDTIPSSSRYFFGTIPLYYDSSHFYEPVELPENSWGHDFVLHADGGRWATTNDKYILDLFVYYTGDDPDSVPGNYTASGGLVYSDDSANARYLPFDEYIFFDSPGAGKVPKMTNPGSVFHMHLDDIKDTLARKRVGFGNWYAFVCVLDAEGKTAYYAQQQLNFADVDSGMFSGTTEFPDWDDYKPDYDDDNTTTPTIINNYNDYTQFQTPPSDFDFDTYAEWIYTNVGIINDNIGILNDNIISFFESFEDFISDFYPFFTRKFAMIADHIDDSVDALARYIKDINVVSTYNGNVVVDNMKNELENLFVPDKEYLTDILNVIAPWFGQVTDSFNALISPTPSNVRAAALSVSGSAPADLDSCVFTISLPTYDGSDSLMSWKSFDIDLADYKNDSVYEIVVYLLDAGGFFACIRIGFQILGISIGSSLEEPEPEHKKIGFR